jgi:hypothetical protein
MIDDRRHSHHPDSFAVRFPDDRPPRYFYWDDVASRRLRPDMLTSEQALEQAKAFARAEGDKSIAKASIALAGPIAGSRSRIGSIRRSAECGTVWLNRNARKTSQKHLAPRLH